MSNTDKLAQCFRDILELKNTDDVTALAYQQHPSWDSVAHMRLIAALETEFDIMMETDQILDLSDYSKAIKILESHHVSFA